MSDAESPRPVLPDTPALPDTLALPVSMAPGATSPDPPGPSRRRNAGRDEKRHQVRWIWVGCGLVLLVPVLVLVVRNTAGDAPGGGTAAMSSPRPGSAQTATDSSNSTRPVSESALVASPIVGVQSGKCIDVAGGSAADLTRIVLSTCDGGVAQAISHTAAGELRVLGKCLDAMNRGTAAGTPIILYTCNGQLNQKWNLAPNGTITSVQSNLCLDATAQGTTDGTPLQLYACNGGENQAWDS